jgi:glutamyl-tRNA synthetase
VFNWLQARRHGGTFVLRIEDTDAERSSDEMVAGILESLRWLGLDWDEGPGVGGAHGPYFQSQRRPRHRETVSALVSSGRAYYCYCTKDELAARRSAAEAAGTGWHYDRVCRDVAADEIARREAAGTPRIVRFRVPEGRTAFDDLVRGRIEVEHQTIDDFVIERSDGSPTYQLSVVADDVDMEISHVVRGDDHISNTPKQILLYRAMGAAVPTFAHVPLILGPDKKRLSKRHGATSVGEYAAQGILPEAMVNFLALLGWSPGDDREVLSPEELVSLFSLDRISGGSAVFDAGKLGWFNQQHIGRMSAATIVERLAFTDHAPNLLAAVDLVKVRARRLSDITPMLRPFVEDRVHRDPAAVATHLGSLDLAPHLAAWRGVLETVTPFDAPALEQALRALAEERGIKPKILIHATRVAVTGQAVSPGLFDVLELVGRERVIARLAEAEADLTGAGA